MKKLLTFASRAPSTGVVVRAYSSASVVKLVALPPIAHVADLPRAERPSARDHVGPAGYRRAGGRRAQELRGHQARGRVAVDRVRLEEVQPAVDQERHHVLERAARRARVRLGVGGDVVDDDGGPHDQRQPQVDGELVVLTALVQRRAAGGRVVGVDAAEAEVDHAAGDVDVAGQARPRVKGRRAGRLRRAGVRQVEVGHVDRRDPELLLAEVVHLARVDPAQLAGGRHLEVLEIDVGIPVGRRGHRAHQPGLGRDRAADGDRVDRVGRLRRRLGEGVAGGIHHVERPRPIELERPVGPVGIGAADLGGRLAPHRRPDDRPVRRARPRDLVQVGVPESDRAPGPAPR